MFLPLTRNYSVSIPEHNLTDKFHLSLRFRHERSGSSSLRGEREREREISKDKQGERGEREELARETSLRVTARARMTQPERKNGRC